METNETQKTFVLCECDRCGHLMKIETGAESETPCTECEQEWTEVDEDGEEARRYALAVHLGEKPGDVENAYDNVYRCGREEYLVLTEDEAEEAWDEELERYLDECVLPELSETAQAYFDRESWKRDARHDGRGHALSGYDGNECDSEGFVLFRIN